MAQLKWIVLFNLIKCLKRRWSPPENRLMMKTFNVAYCGPNYFVLENICYLFLKHYLGFQETEAERTSTKITGKGDNTVKAIQPFLGRV